ncbi:MULTISPECIES: HTTM domain-containing protein [Streptomyces]|uniref:Membrane protein n=1 Tax=Streptomyces pyridomyceticus TaxID=68260 RepID=F6K7F8_9ACTN|nr:MULTISPECIES: HTTM domain-containing protein [Streptomyces]AEF33075.1 membrane protein [Streptomyces pyridomyceticus]
MDRLKNSAASALRGVSSHPKYLVGLSLCRILLGLSTTLYYVSNIPYRDFLWGPHSYSGFEAFKALTGDQHIFSLYALSDGRTWFNLVYFVGLAVSLAWTVLGSRSLTVVHVVFMTSIYHRNYTMWEGGDALTGIVLILMMGTTANAHFSPLAKRVRARLERRAGEPHLRTSLHNTAAVLIVFQACVVYAVSALWKVAAPQWQEGTALYYISHVWQYTYSSAFPQLMDSLVLTAIVTYFTIVVQLLAVPAALTSRRWFREAVVLGIAAMHIGIMAGMGLMTFGLAMMAIDAVIVRDADYEALLRRVRLLRERVAARRGDRKAAAEEPAAEELSAA